jgi:hypothetical protein
MDSGASAEKKALQPAFIPLPMQLAGADSHAASSNIRVEIQHPTPSKRTA